ncbi:hypothetical protein BD769DRAFT_326686 [Suillus cothurnatus]|nr:hypothetical protein BD769DRAFT_326686 [Suillus cothurnatus]
MISLHLHLALVLMYVISQSALPMPKCVAFFSPTADLTFASYTPLSHDTTYLSNHQALASQYLGNFSANSPLASGALIPFTASWPKTLVLTGTADGCAQSSQIVVSGIQRAGERAELVEYADLTHVLDASSHLPAVGQWVGEACGFCIQLKELLMSI